MSTILDQIVATKRTEVADARRRTPVAALREAIEAAPPVRDFAEALRRGPGRVRLIAEVKKASPSAGVIREEFDPVGIAREYAEHGASCISVLTDESYFQGRLAFLTSIRAAVDRPLLRKDFIIDEYQVLEARAAGADCVLLIAECLSGAQMKDLHQAARALGMHTLIELYDRHNLPAVLDTGGEIIGVNNRDLRTFVTDLEHTIRMSREIPGDRILVGESGIKTSADVARLAEAGVHAMLVGESLMRQPDIGAATAALLSA